LRDRGVAVTTDYAWTAQPDLGDVAGFEPHNASSTVLSNAILAKAGPGFLYGFSIYSNKASSQFIQVFDLSAIPSDGAVPVAVYTVAATANLTLNWFPPRVFRAGCVICNSSTVATKTIASADTWFDVQVM
jgi:hypothetical protein